MIKRGMAGQAMAGTNIERELNNRWPRNETSNSARVVDSAAHAMLGIQFYHYFV